MPPAPVSRRKFRKLDPPHSGQREWLVRGDDADAAARAMFRRQCLGKARGAGVETVEVDVSELIKAGGGIHCMTGFLKREEP